MQHDGLMGSGWLFEPMILQNFHVQVSGSLFKISDFIPLSGLGGYNTGLAFSELPKSVA